MSVRFRICLAVWVVTVICSIACNTTRAESFDTGDGWSIEISPLPISPAVETASLGTPVTLEATAEPADGEAEPEIIQMPVCQRPDAGDYQRIYDSIPFNRAEYNVNPSYRHDSTMELLTGNARHQTIVKHETRRYRRPQLRYGYVPYRYNNPRYGLNYYFYFPYWNYRGIY